MESIWITGYGMWGTGDFTGIENDRIEYVDVSQWSGVDWDEFEDSRADLAIETAKLINERKAK